MISKKYAVDTLIDQIPELLPVLSPEKVGKRLGNSVVNNYQDYVGSLDDLMSKHEAILDDFRTKLTTLAENLSN